MIYMVILPLTWIKVKKIKDLSCFLKGSLLGDFYARSTRCNEFYLAFLVKNQTSTNA